MSTTFAFLYEIFYFWKAGLLMLMSQLTAARSERERQTRGGRAMVFSIFCVVTRSRMWRECAQGRVIPEDP